MIKGFSLIELMVTVAIVAILAAVAMPMAKTYAVKAKITKALASATPFYKTMIENYYTKNGVGPANPNVAGIPGTMASNGTWFYVSRAAGDLPSEDVISQIGVYDHTIGSPKIAAFVIVMQIADLNITSLGPTNIELVYILNNINGVLTWSCVFGGGSNVYNAYLPTGCTP